MNVASSPPSMLQRRGGLRRAPLRCRLSLGHGLHLYLLWLFFALALGARVWRLSDHSLWFDETMSLYWARLSPAEIWRIGLALEQDPHPPLYYLLLHYLVKALGESEAAVRSLSVAAGALLTFPMYGLGDRLAGRAVGLMAALLVAINPFLVWYGQEARMYALALTLGSAGLWAFLRALERGRWRWVLAAAAAMLAALYTYVLSAVLLPVMAFWWLLLLWRRRDEEDEAPRPTRLQGGLAALILIAVGFAPLAWRAWLATATPADLPGGAPPSAWALLLHWLSIWTIHKAAGAPLAPWVVAALAAAGLIAAPAQGRLRLGGYLLLPLATALLLGRRDPLVLAETRYFIAVVPALLLAIAACLGWLIGRQRALGLAMLLLVAGVTLAALRQNWQPQHRREDWREAARYIAQHAGPADAILVHVDYMHIAFRHYYRGPLPVFFPFHDRLSDPAQVAPPLEGMAGYETIWLVQSHTGTFDPSGLVERWLAERYPLVTEQYPAGVLLKGYAVRSRFPSLPEGARPLDVSFDAPVRLAGCRLGDARLRARDDRSHPPSGWVHVTLYWQATAPLGQDYLPIVRVVDERGQVWGDRLERAASTIRRFPPSRWPVGELVRDEEDVNLNPVTPPGRYRLAVGLTEEGGKEIPAFGADALAGQGICGEVEIIP
jgi:mannosyltransferase